MAETETSAKCRAYRTPESTEKQKSEARETLGELTLFDRLQNWA